MLTQEQCPVCMGTGRLEYEEEAGFHGEWRRRRGGGSDPLWPLLVEQRPDLARYTEDDCEVCHGTGTVEIEHVRCRIF